MVHGLMTDRQREFIKGEREGEIEDPEQYTRNTRYKTRQTIEQIPKDLRIFAETGNQDLVDEFFAECSQLTYIEENIFERIDELEETILAETCGEVEQELVLDSFGNYAARRVKDGVK